MRRLMVLLGCCLVLSNLALAEVKITFEAAAAVATGITPGADAVWFGVSRDREEWSDHFYHWRQATSGEDNDGSATLVREGGFPLLTVLLFVDIPTGEFAIETPFPREAPLPPLDLSRAQTAPDGSLLAISQEGSQIDALIVRPGVGAWSLSVTDGSSLDQDGVGDGVVTISFSAARPFGGELAPLDGVRVGDVVALADVKGPWVRAARFQPKGGEE
jgi:hypothetical protein